MTSYSFHIFFQTFSSLEVNILTLLFSDESDKSSPSFLMGPFTVHPKGVCVAKGSLWLPVLTSSGMNACGTSRPINNSTLDGVSHVVIPLGWSHDLTSSVLTASVVKKAGKCSRDFDRLTLPHSHANRNQVDLLCFHVSLMSVSMERGTGFPQLEVG